MIKRFAASHLLAGMLLATAVTACNDDNNSYQDDYGYTPETMYSSTAVTAFNIKSDTKVLAGLDSVFFSINLNSGMIYNADSLPKGTKITRLVPNVETNGSSKIEFIVRGTVQTDTTIVYTGTTSDSIDFSGTVIMRVTSLNNNYNSSYQVKVNVHRTVPDSLHWGKVAWKEMPASPKAQKTVTLNDKVYTFLSTSAGNKLWLQTVPGDDGTVTDIDGTIDINSIVAGDNTIFALDNNGTLYTSTDGTAWTVAGGNYYHLYGVYGDKVLAVKKSGSDYYHTVYPATAGVNDTPVSADCPISGTSQILLFENKWAESPLAIMIGGRTANGKLTGATWGFDGNSWAKISTAPLPTACEGMILFPYFTFRTTALSWRVTKYSTLFAIGGRDEDGDVTRTVYISKDQGINWHKADSLLQMPDYVPEAAFAQAVVWDSTLGRSAAMDGWNETPSRQLPPWWTIAGTYSDSRATKPVTTWECPFIYLYGGYDAYGQLNATVWRGVINRLMFKPLE